MELSWGGAATSSLLEFSRTGNVFCAYSAGVTSLPAYSATALGPILWNGATQNPQLKAVIIGVGISLTTASGAAVGIGLTWGSQLTTFPVQNTPIAATTAVTLTSSTLVNGPAPQCTAYNAGTVASAGKGYMQLMNVPTTAVTALPLADAWIPIDGAIIIPQGGWVALAASATATSAVLQYSIVWAEVTR